MKVAQAFSLCILFLSQIFAAQPDRVCATCHQAIYDSYESTPMAQSSGNVDNATAPSGPDTAFAAGQNTYRIEPGGQVRVAGEFAASHRLRYFIGAGVTGRSYVYDAGGYLFQSPVAWYASIRKWDLSPGYEKDSGVNLIRPVESGCLNCHATGIQAMPHTQNGYAEPAFVHTGITCERCHGRADDHVARMKSGHASDAGIVNPAKLDRANRDSICAQCHLRGVARIAKTGAPAYTPGDLLFNSISVFVWSEGARPVRANSHFEQLARSACWRKSDGRLWCGTCHDPHRVVPAADRARYFRTRCETCHGNSAPKCSAGPAIQARAGGNCIACHMPSHHAATVQHAAQTDHSIQRSPDISAFATPVPPDAELTPFPGSAAGRRELGLAYSEQAISRSSSELGMRAYQILSAVHARRQDDSAVSDQLAQLLDRMGRQGEACELYRKIAGSPDAPTGALVNAGTCAAGSGNIREAMGLWKRALARNPGEESARLNLAVAQFRSGDAASARASIEAGLNLDPFWRRGRAILAALP